MAWRGQIWDTIMQRLGVDRLPDFDAFLVKFLDPRPGVSDAFGVPDNPIFVSVDGIDPGITVPVSATDLDIRDLTSATDSVTSVPSAGLRVTGSANALNADLIPSMDVSGYRSMVFQLQGTWSGTVRAQISNDNFTTSTNIWVASYGNELTVISTGPTTNGFFQVPLSCDRLRLRLTAYSSGPVNVVAYFYKEAVDIFTPVAFSKAEDTAHSTADIGVPAWAVRKNTPVALAADGDYIPIITDAYGRLHVINHDYALSVARGMVTGSTQVNKFGAAPTGVQLTATDIWSRADSVPTQQIWLAPTAARIHALVSSSANDDGSPVGTGARTLRVYGLTSWATAETSEDITLDGLTPVNTANSYVIIHRMKVLTCGASGPNVGTITATAAAPDSTITAVILPGDGQTEMAIYGVPSTQSLYLTRWSVGIDKTAASAVTCDFELRVNENPNVQTIAFLRKDDISVQSTGTNHVERLYGNPVKFAGPCLVKVQGIASTADTDAKSGFDAYIIDN